MPQDPTSPIGIPVDDWIVEYPEAQGRSSGGLLVLMAEKRSDLYIRYAEKGFGVLDLKVP